jgi:uncharacterized protein YjiS (DUF1127 family)
VPWFRPRRFIVLLVRQWHRGRRDRAELRMLTEHGFGFSDMGVTLAAVRNEAGRWPGEQWGRALNEAATLRGKVCASGRSWPPIPMRRTFSRGFFEREKR